MVVSLYPAQATMSCLNKIKLSIDLPAYRSMSAFLLNKNQVKVNSPMWDIHRENCVQLKN